MIRGVASFVWQDVPGTLTPGVDVWLVKAANGNLTTGSGHDYARSYATWANKVGAERTHAWTWLYGTTNGSTAAEQLHRSAPHAAGYLIDVEGDDPHWRNLDRVVRDFVPRMRELAPGKPVGFTSYPDRKQAIAHGAPWDAMVELCDYGCPQVYYSSQGKRWAQIVADHKGKPVIAAFSPGDWKAGWEAQATTAIRRFGGVALWRYPDTRTLADPIARLHSLRPVGAPTPPKKAVTPASCDVYGRKGIVLRYHGTGHALDHGYAVQRVQLALGLAGANVDGLYGPTTERLVRAFQHAHHLTADGVVGAKTWAALARYGKE